MRKMISVLLALLYPALALAQGELPQGAKDALWAAHPGYAVAVYDGWGDETRGQYAAVLKNGEDNILCIAEKAEGDAAYSLTVDNTNAVYDGAVLPSLLIDTGGDSLFYTYHDAWRSLHVHALKADMTLSDLTHAVRSETTWSDVDVTLYKQEGGEYRSIWSALGDGLLRYEHAVEDENGNVLDRWYDVPVLVSEEGENAMLLERFDIAMYDADPADGLTGLVETPGFTRGMMDEGDTLEQLAVSRVHLAALISRPGVGSFVTISEWDVGRYVPVNVLGVSPDAYLDTYHAGEGHVLITNGGMMYTVSRAERGKWYLTGVDPNTQRTVGPDWAYQNDIANIGRNDGYIYGDTWWDDFLPGHIDLPATFEGVLNRLDTSVYALVRNPDPEDRLHLRAEAKRDAQSLGKFYNRTPVRVLDRGEEWTRVRVGIGEESLTGYMMTKYLAFGDAEKTELACAFPQLFLKEEYHERGVLMLDEPGKNADSRGTFNNGRHDFIVGVYGDEWFIVMRADGAVGYVLQSAFWEGNG